jgi:hypothetical protein
MPRVADFAIHGIDIIIRKAADSFDRVDMKVPLFNKPP